MVKNSPPNDWMGFKISDLCKKRNYEKINSDLYIGLENIGQGNNILISKGNTQDFKSAKNVFLKNDILYGKLRPNLNKVWLATENGYCSTEIIPLITNEKILPEILLYSLLKQDFVSYAISSSFGTKMPRVDFSIVGNFLIYLPEIDEQKKIVKNISDIDELIDSLESLIQKKKNIKQGAMQELLTGKRRLEGFIGEWDTKELEKITTIRKGELITEKTRIDGSIPVIGGGKTSSYSHNSANRKKNTITISASGANAGFVSFHKSPIFASDCSTIDENTTFSIKFIYYQLLRLQKNIYYLQTGGAQPHIHPKDLYSLKIPIPKDIDEQYFISNILSDMDYEIEQLETQKEKYTNLKQAMMQKLLTGEIRLV